MNVLRLLALSCLTLLPLTSAAQTGTVPPEQIARHTFLIPGVFPDDRGPDANTYVLQGKDGLIVIDTGRHDAHREKIEAFARSKHLPITAIINTHWHLDHVSGDAGLRAAYPQAKVYGSSAVDGALTDFLAVQAERTRASLEGDTGKLSPLAISERRHFLDTMAHSQALRPDVVVGHTETMDIAGRTLDVHLAKDAATAGDVWIFDPSTRIAFVGDLVTFPAAFLDTACPEGWKSALEEVSHTNFKAVAPGHGPLLSRAGFESYRSAFSQLIACSASAQNPDACADGWIAAVKQAGQLTSVDTPRARFMTVQYITEVLRPNGGSSRYCSAGK